jgi:cytochrome P450
MQPHNAKVELTATDGNMERRTNDTICAGGSMQFCCATHPLYAHLRAAQPVHCVTLPSGRRRWLITRYDDAERVLRDPRLVKAGSFDALPPEIQPLTKHMLNCDPPDHSRLRALVIFSPPSRAAPPAYPAHR